MLDRALRRIGEALFPARCIGCQRRGTSLCAVEVSPVTPAECRYRAQIGTFA
jgi:hypothetical protein